MKRRQVLRMALSLLLTLSMLLSLPLYLYAADSHRSDYKNPNAVYPTEPYYYETNRSPDGEHLLRVRVNEVDHYTYYDLFTLINAEDGTVLRDFDIHAIYKAEKGIPLYGVNWSPDGRFVIIDYPHTLNMGLATLVIDTEELDFWMPISTLTNYDNMRRQDKTLPARDVEGMRPWKVERWISDDRVSLITEYINGEARIWSRVIFDAVKCDVVLRQWGNSADLDNPNNPIWTRATAHGVPAYNTGDFSVPSPDGAYSVVVRAADKMSDADTWNTLYESITVPYLPSSFLKEVDLPLHNAKTSRTLWHDISVVWSPDGRYFVYQSEDNDSLAWVYCMESGGAKFLNYELEGASKVRIIAFSVFDEVLYEIIRTAPTGEQTRELRIEQMSSLRRHRNLYVSPVNGFAEAEAALPAALTTPTVKDGFEGFIAVSKTHETGLDGLFRIGEQYKYIHMGAGVIPYSEYVSDAAADADLLFDRYRVVRSDEGVWVLDENENVVYAGVGAVFEFGQLALTYADAEGENSLWRVGGDSFRLILDRITEMAAQEDGSVYVIHTVGKGPYETGMLSHVDADGTVTTIGEYDGDLSEFRRFDQRG